MSGYYIGVSGYDIGVCEVVFFARTVCTFSLVSGLFRNLLWNSVGWRVFRPLCDPTLSGPFPVTVARPYLSVYVVFHPALITNVRSCRDWSCFWSHAASLLPFLMSVDEVVSIVLLMSKASCAAWCWIRGQSVMAWMWVSTGCVQLGHAVSLFVCRRRVCSLSCASPVSWEVCSG